MKLHEVYQLCRTNGDAGDRARRILEQRHWFTSVADLDPRTGDALPISLGLVLRRAAQTLEEDVVKDRLWRIVWHSRDAIGRIIKSLNETPRRDQAVLPVRAVRELNAASFIALSRRPGRNVKEKLGDRPYMQAVRRFQSIDLPENRLFKEYLTRLVELLELRRSHLGQSSDDGLIADIHRWLVSDQAQEISRWQNLPANNTLLSHRDYRRIWDSWRWMLSLDTDLETDDRELEERDALISWWNSLVDRYKEEKTLFAEVPVIFDYDTFKAEPWCEPVCSGSPKVHRFGLDRPKILDPACVDLTSVRPLFATQKNPKLMGLPDLFAWQNWDGVAGRVNLELFNADLLQVHPDASTVCGPDLLLDSNAESRFLDAAARAFSKRLGSIFTHSELQWLYPDHTNDFSLAVLRRNLNAKFSQAEPLPRSVAAVFQHIDHSRIERDGFEVVVYDLVGGVLTATKLIAQFSSELKERAPETRGFYWERTPPFVLEQGAESWNVLADVPYVDGDGSVSIPPKRHATKVALDFHDQYRHVVGDSHVQIVIEKSPVEGGVRLHQMQKLAGDFPLWRDQIPELSIKAIVNGLWETISLVGSEHKVQPIRGREVEIPISADTRAPLGPGVGQFEFPLFQGRSENRIGFEAFLRSPVFPLSKPCLFRLRLTYTYGADDPYRLEFLALDAGGRRDATIPPIIAEWRPIAQRSDADLARLPVPDFGEKADWEALQKWTNQDPRSTTRDLESNHLADIEKALKALKTISSSIVILPPAAQIDETELDLARQIDGIRSRRAKGSVLRILEDVNDRLYLFADVQGETVFCHETQFVEKKKKGDIKLGDQIFLTIDRSNREFDRPSGREITFSSSFPAKLESRIRFKLAKAKKPQRVEIKGQRKDFESAQLASHIVWSHGQSILDEGCPVLFRSAVETGRGYADEVLANENSSKTLRIGVLRFFSKMHKDAPSSVIAELERLSVEASGIRRVELQCIGWALGDVSEEWQQRLLSRVLEPDFTDTSYVLSLALLKCPAMTEKLNYEDIKMLLLRLRIEMTQILQSSVSPSGLQRCARIFEVVLGLLYARRSDDVRAKVLLAPEGEFGTFFLEMIEHVARLTRTHAIDLYSRVVMDQVDKSQDEAWQPDLLVSLRRCLSGSNGSTALRISWASEVDETTGVEN